MLSCGTLLTPHAGYIILQGSSKKSICTCSACKKGERRRVRLRLGRRGGDHSSCHTLSLKSYHLKIYSSCHTISPLSFKSNHLNRIPAVKRPSHIDQVRDGRAGALMSEEFADRDVPRERLRERLVSSWSSLWSSASFPTSSPALSPTLSCASNSGSHASGHGGPPSSSDGTVKYLMQSLARDSSLEAAGCRGCRGRA